VAKSLIIIATIAVALNGNIDMNENCPNSGLPYEGYYDSWCNWVPKMISNNSWMIGMPEHVVGKMTFYGIYSMSATADFRGIDYIERGCPMGGVSLMSPIDIGKLVYIKVKEIWYGPFCSVDCAKRGDMYSIVVYRDEVVEVNFEFAEFLGMVEKKGDSYIVDDWGLDNVEVYIVPDSYPWVIFPKNDPIDFSDYWLERIEFINYQENTIFPVGTGWKVKNRNEYYFEDYIIRKFGGGNSLFNKIPYVLK